MSGKEMGMESESLEYTPTWVVAVVCSVICLISLCAERLLHRFGKRLKNKQQNALLEALRKLEEELMLLGFISLLLAVFQGLIGHICISTDLASHMLPCKEALSTSGHEIHIHEDFTFRTKKGRQLLFEDMGSENCAKKGKVPLLSLKVLHQLNIFIFVLVAVQIFCATTMVLGGAKILQWKHWENSIRHETPKPVSAMENTGYTQNYLEFKRRAVGFWRKSPVVSWMMSFFRQFYGTVTKSDYTAMRLGFIMTHCPTNPRFDFHKYIVRTLEVDLKKVVGISCYLWLFVMIFLLLNVEGWHMPFWISFLPLILLLLVGAKLEHIITRLAEEVVDRNIDDPRGPPVKPSDKYFWFGRPSIVLYLIHFILFQNSFEIAFFLWIWCTYGFDSCIMEKVGYIIPRLIIGLIVQVLCIYSTLPLYAIVTQMGSMFKKGIFNHDVQTSLEHWVERTKRKKKHSLWKGSSHGRTKDETSNSFQMQAMADHAFADASTAEQTEVVLEGITTSVTEYSD